MESNRGRKAHKPIANEDLKRVLPLEHNLKLVEQVETNMHAFEKASMAGIEAAAAGYKTMAELWKNSCAKGWGSCMEGSEKSVTDTVGMGYGFLEGWQKMDGELMTMWREAIECRSIDELYNLQRRTVALMMGDWLQAVQRATCNATAHMAPVMCMLPPD